MGVRLTICSLAFGATLPLAAQTGVVGVRPLAFGTVLPGVPAVVSRTDPAKSGQFNLTGRRNGFVLIRFTLPTVMNGPAGATMPLVFSTADAGYSVSQAVGNQVVIDPHTAHLQRLSGTGRGSVFVGGTTTPAANQRAGDYKGTLTLSATFF
jgi:uncharacterized protein DUF4402